MWCTERAGEFGFFDEPDEWANLGQGAPEVRKETDLRALPASKQKKNLTEGLS